MTACDTLLGAPHPEPTPEPVPQSMPQPAVNPFAELMQLIDVESRLADQVEIKTSTAFKGSKNFSKVLVMPVDYRTYNVTDLVSHQARQLQAVNRMTLEFPLALKSHPAYEGVIANIKALAEKLADDRGAATIQFYFNPADAKAQKIKFGSAKADSPAGHPITVSKAADRQIKRGMQRLVVEGAGLDGASAGPIRVVPVN